MVIRRAKIDDIDILVELLTTLFTIETDFIIDREKQQNGLLLMLEQNVQGCIMVAERDKKVIGMCSGQLLVSTAEGALKVIVEDLVVARNERNCGIGLALLSGIQKWAISCGASRMDLLADKRNKSALNFYRQHNWKCTEMIALHKKL
ncbi:MAG: GNAT family N-acetyltransferase [Clostridium sp.]|uniref:GNAT family N-acetyltransferase n=1 Tax=Clostridium sp. TaxID=1506 RepID=UPI0025C30391|nr:GNAT family N-acetyltransferase [Clostridium sp.]MCE5221375.1 GNAT family N-acetyltransferase [Clostridium sp.]